MSLSQNRNWGYSSQVVKPRFRAKLGDILPSPNPLLIPIFGYICPVIKCATYFRQLDNLLVYMHITGHPKGDPVDEGQHIISLSFVEEYFDALLPTSVSSISIPFIAANQATL
jgi:hypothetical protein